MQLAMRGRRGSGLYRAKRRRSRAGCASRGWCGGALTAGCGGDAPGGGGGRGGAEWDSGDVPWGQCASAWALGSWGFPQTVRAFTAEDLERSRYMAQVERAGEASWRLGAQVLDMRACGGHWRALSRRARGLARSGCSMRRFQWAQPCSWAGCSRWAGIL